MNKDVLYQRIDYCVIFFSILICLLFILAGCGGGGSGGGGSLTTGLTSSGIAVDPYIKGAKFEEIPANGGPAIQESTPSDSNGHFSFPLPLTQGSIIRIKAGSKGLHNGTPYTGNLKRIVDDQGELTVSPLTTLEANGYSPQEIAALLADAGLPGLTADDITVDPMAGLIAKRSTITEADLRRLQANIAINSFFKIQENDDFDPHKLIVDPDLLDNSVLVVKTVLTEDQVNRILAENRSALAGQSTEFGPSSCINGAVVIIDTVIKRMQQDPTLDPVAEAQRLLDKFSQLALFYHVRKHRGHSDIEDGIARGELPDAGEKEEPVIDDFDDIREHMLPVANAGKDQLVAIGDQVSLDGRASYSLGSEEDNEHSSDDGGTTIQVAGHTDNEDGFMHKPGKDWPFKNGCTACHGSDLTGDFGPSCYSCHGREWRENGSSAGGDENSQSGTTNRLIYRWSFLEKPAGSSAVLSDPTAVTPTFTADRGGTYLLSLTVTDDHLPSLPDTVTIIASTGNVAPIADAGQDRNVSVGDTVVLDGSDSSDANNDPLYYEWYFVEQPIGSGAILTGASTMSPSFIPNLAGRYSIELMVGDGQAISRPDSVIITAINQNIPPVASGGPDRNVVVGNSVPLDGSGSSDANNDQLSYTWSLLDTPAGSSAVLSDPFAMAPSFIADLEGNYTVELVVNDGTADSPADTVIITAQTSNIAPIANGGPGQNVPTGIIVSLDGSASTDPNNDPLTYSWSFGTRPQGSNATLSSTNIVNPIFTPDVDGVYVVNLVVNDGLTDSAPSSVTITATTANGAPVANAGPNQSVKTGDLVLLDGSASYDPDNDQLTYAWSISSQPPASTATLSVAGIVDPTFTPDMAGVYVVNLIVNDGFTNSAPVSVTITAANANSTPVANGGLDLTANTGDTVQLNGSASYDPDNDPLTYTWTLTAQPTGSSATLIDANTVAPSFVADVTGSYVISLVVNDTTLNSVPDSVMVTVTSPPSNCTLCHGQPPDGTIFPNTQGTHPVHTSLPNVQNDCNICHSTAAHNSVVDVTFAATYNAKSGTASLNSATGTCSNVSCHGGQTTPAWANGTLDVNTQCSSCHQSGNMQHNSFNSGFHSFHVNTMRYACTVCHDTSKLATNHFSNLDTPLLEGPASATIGGGTTRVTSYVASSRQCAAMCHETRAW